MTDTEPFGELLNAILPEIKSGSYNQLLPAGIYEKNRSLENGTTIDDDQLSNKFWGRHSMSRHSANSSGNPIIIFEPASQILPQPAEQSATVVGISHNITRSESGRSGNFTVTFITSDNSAKLIENEASQHPEFVYYLLKAIYDKVGGLHIKSIQAAASIPNKLAIERWNNGKNLRLYPNHERTFSKGFNPNTVLKLIPWDTTNQTGLGAPEKL